MEYGLDQNYILKEIAERVGKDPTTISKEIKVSKKKVNDIQP
ncbi:MAG: helix-turn-helix domain-containing protein [Tenericutes bacterium]|nr:helix-turn-helix domain-containing protein [Mycoplasmatota bacterium]